MPHCPSCMKRMERCWAFSLQSSQPASLVGINLKSLHFHRLFCFLSTGCVILFTSSTLWISNCLAGSTDFGNVSFIVPGIHPFFYIGTDVFNHTEEYTKAAGMGTRGSWEWGYFVKLNCTTIRRFLSSFFSLPPLLSFLFCFFFARSWKSPVVHPAGSQGPGYDSCGCSVQLWSAEASEGGLQPGQSEPGNMTRRADLLKYRQKICWSVTDNWSVTA